MDVFSRKGKPGKAEKVLYALVCAFVIGTAGFAVTTVFIFVECFTN